MFNFEKLEAWQEAVAFADRVYSITKAFPADERFGLTSQMRRASVSVSANLAEGSTRTSTKDFQRFIEIAFGSLIEVVSHLHVAKRQGFTNENSFNDIYTAADRLARILSGLKRSLSPRP